jgi:hypothetical protein
VTDPDTITMAGIRKSIDLMHDVFGPDLDAGGLAGGVGRH